MIVQLHSFAAHIASFHVLRSRTRHLGFPIPCCCSKHRAAALLVSRPEPRSVDPLCFPSRSSGGFIPFRDSVLTRLLSGALTSACRTRLLACVIDSPDRRAESARTLGVGVFTLLGSLHPANPGRSLVGSWMLFACSLARQ